MRMAFRHDSRGFGETHECSSSSDYRISFRNAIKDFDSTTVIPTDFNRMLRISMILDLDINKFFALLLRYSAGRNCQRIRPLCPDQLYVSRRARNDITMIVKRKINRKIAWCIIGG